MRHPHPAGRIALGLAYQDAMAYTSRDLWRDGVSAVSAAVCSLVLAAHDMRCVVCNAVGVGCLFAAVGVQFGLGHLADHMAAGGTPGACRVRWPFVGTRAGGREPVLREYTTMARGQNLSICLRAGMCVVYAAGAVFMICYFF